MDVFHYVDKSGPIDKIKLDRQYLRVCAIYRLMKHKKINKEQALQLSTRPLRDNSLLPKNIHATIDMWEKHFKGPLARGWNEE